MLIDLSHQFQNDMPAFPGDPNPSLKFVTSVSEDGFCDSFLKTGLHVGTHIDAPCHMIDGGKLICDYPISRFCGRGIVVDARGKKQIDFNLLKSCDIRSGDIVLVNTGFYHHFGTPSTYFYEYPEPTPEFVDALIKAQPSIVGFDTPGPDRSAPFVNHIKLLTNEILIIENLNHLDELDQSGVGAWFEVFAFPINIVAEASPLRVVARIESEGRR